MHDSKLNNFFSEYGFEFLETIDYQIHHRALSKFKDMYGKSTGVIFDIGANAGSFIRAAKDVLTDIELHAFEPHPVLSDYISNKHIEVAVNNACCGDSDGEISINIPDTSVVISSILDRPVFKELSSQTIHKHISKCFKIDTYCKLKNIKEIDYIKIDVEGYEYRVMLGMEELLKENKIKCGHFEILVQELHPIEDIYNFLKKYNYKLDFSISDADAFFYL
jgi:FkbM family methyltransferase